MIFHPETNAIIDPNCSYKDLQKNLHDLLERICQQAATSDDLKKGLAEVKLAVSTSPTGAGAGGGGLTSISLVKPFETPNGVITTFSFSSAPAIVFYNGAQQRLTTDYTQSGASITFTFTPATGDNVYALVFS